MDQIRDRIIERVHERREELVELALELANIYAPVGSEQTVAERIVDWYREHHIEQQLQELTHGRANALGRLRGSGTGRSLLFNAHLDTEAAGPDFDNLMQVPNANDRGAWREGDRLFGHTLLNDRHAHAMFMLAADVIRELEVPLAGDVWLTSVAGETGQSPVDEYQGLTYEGKGFGTRHLLQHGVSADVGIVSETSGFVPCWIHCGAVYAKVTLRGRNMYTPRFTRPDSLRDHPNAVVTGAAAVLTIEEWARDYTERMTRETPCGTLAPNALVGAIRGGIPWRPNRSSPYCALYVDIRIPPEEDVTAILNSLRAALKDAELVADVEPYLVQPGAIGSGVEGLVSDLRRIHREVRGQDAPERASSAVVSMWRDTNVLNNAGIPSVNLGPPRGRAPVQGTGYLAVDDLIDCTAMYALAMLDVSG